MSKKEVADWEKNVTLCKKMLHKIMKMPNAFIFSEPVDWKALELPDYPAIVKKPMDLGTIETKLAKGKYATVQNFVADVTLVWNNARLYNMEGSDIHHLANHLDSEFTAKLEVHSGPLREPSGGGGGSTGGGGGGSTGGGKQRAGGGEALPADAVAACKTVLKELKKHPEVGAFLEPVDWKVHARRGALSITCSAQRSHAGAPHSRTVYIRLAITPLAVSPFQPP